MIGELVAPLKEFMKVRSNKVCLLFDESDEITNPSAPVSYTHLDVYKRQVPNRRLFRRWVMAQMFHMMSYTPHRSKEPVGVTNMIHRLGYDYQWKMLMDELYAQMKMSERDAVNFTDRNRWFNTDVVMAMANDYICLLYTSRCV